MIPIAIERRHKYRPSGGFCDIELAALGHD